MYELKSISYEEARAEHFRALMKKEQRKIDWWQARDNKLRPLDMASRSHIECSEAGIRYNFYNDALEALEKQPKWISVEDRLPEDNERVLVWRSRINEMDVFDGRFVQIRCETAEMRRIHGITHWMPLPEAPKEG